ncbi:MAG: hypothetical protein K2X57_32110 [Xanthobacteraceae bacterium]|nr:hypothetical protein [Xanthobacteraceae bacterium]
MAWEDMVQLPQKMPGISECAIYLPQRKVKMEAVRNQSSSPRNGEAVVAGGAANWPRLEGWAARASWFETREDALLTMRFGFLPTRS